MKFRNVRLRLFWKYAFCFRKKIMNMLVSENSFEPHVRIRKWFYRISFWLLALVLLFALIRHANWNLTLSLLLDLPIATILFCAGVWILSFVFRAIRFQSEWKNAGRIPFIAALRATVLHNAAVLLVPFRVGELGYPVLVRELINVPWQFDSPHVQVNVSVPMLSKAM